MRNRYQLAALTFAGALVIAACSGTSDDETTTTQASAETTTTTEAPATTTTTAEEPMDTTRFVIEVTNISDGFIARDAQAFAIPVDAAEPAPALPGEAYATSFSAAPGERLSFATMFVQSNDWFLAFNPEGLELFDEGGVPITGDVTDRVAVWDAGTEVDQEPGVGEDQAPRQAGPNTGDADPDATVRLVEDLDAAAFVSVMLSHDEGDFTLTVENTSETTDLPTPIAPGVAVVHGAGTPLFVAGVADPGHGLEALAEDGDPSGIVESTMAGSGVVTPLAPGVAVVLDTGTELFVSGASDDGSGLEGLAEDGNAGPYGENTGGTVFAIPAGQSEPGPLFPGDTYAVEIEAEAGQNLTFATMFVQSNDWFFSLGGAGIPLFGADGTPISGDITSLVTLWDAGTEVDQTPGTGADQAPRQAGPDTGADDTNASIRPVDGYAVTDYVQVTITPQS